jgi:hypothetical protein
MSTAHVLDLTNPVLPVQKDIAEDFAHAKLTARSAQSMRRILDSIDAELTPTAAPWAADRQGFADTIAANAAVEFSDAFGRWRQLYDGARTQLMDANRRSEMHGLSAVERRDAKIQQAQANEQIALLERGTTTGSSDFSTYRYLATEGFLPGYNFPRLPLYAYVPAIGAEDRKPPICNARVSLPLPSSDRAARSITRAARIASTRPSCPRMSGPRKAHDWRPTRSLSAMNVAPRTKLPSQNAVTSAARLWAASTRSAMCCA